MEPQTLVDRLLVADVFVVIAGAFWFLPLCSVKREASTNRWRYSAAVGALFTPAIGLLMAAAVISGLLGWWQRRTESSG